MRCVLVGNYGVGNLGDEALREYMLGAFPEVEWLVLSANPRSTEYARLPIGIRSFFGLRWLRTLGAFIRSDTLVFGGGTLFTDIESPVACWLWGLHAFTIWILRRPYALAFQGIGPFRTWMGERIARWVVCRATFISVRDHASFERLAGWHKSTKIVRTFDPVFSLFLSQKNDIRLKNVFTIIPRHNSGDLFIQTCVEMMEKQHPETIRIVTMQPDDLEERHCIQHLQNMFPAAVVLEARGISSLLSFVQSSSFVVTERYHGALAAMAMCVPVCIVSQGMGDKLSELVPFASIPDAGREVLLSSVRTGEEELRVFFHVTNLPLFPRRHD